LVADKWLYARWKLPNFKLEAKAYLLDSSAAIGRDVRVATAFNCNAANIGHIGSRCGLAQVSVAFTKHVIDLQGGQGPQY